MQLNKRRKLSVADQEDNRSSRSALTSSFARNAAQWNLEQDYESRPRKQKKPKDNQRLPIKTQDGLIEQVEEVSVEDSDGSEGSDEHAREEEAAGSNEGEDHQEAIDTKPKLPAREQIVQAKEELARVASLLSEDPEEHVGGLKVLGQITKSEIPTITKLGLVTQCAVYKDIIPGYRIRPLSEQDGKNKVSKEVRKVRNFEQSIVSGYQRYVGELGRLAGLARGSESAASLATVATRCACDLIIAVPHFNFRSELLKVLVDQLSRQRVDETFSLARAAMEKLFAEDEEGNASLEAVGLLCKMIKAKSFRIHESVINMFLSLRLVTEFSHKGSTQRISKDAQQNGDAENKKLSNKEFKKRKERMSKKEKKAFKERREIDKEMKEADATVAHEQRDHNQGETLKLVFGIYFRVLKARTPRLTGTVLEGLVKFAHLINQDFFGDLLEALRELILESGVEEPSEEIGEHEAEDAAETQEEEQDRNLTREALLCVITAFALLQGQEASGAASSLHLDLEFFTEHLYRTLHAAALNPDIELSHKSWHLPDPNTGQTEKATKVNVQTTVVLLLRSLTAVLLPSNARSVAPVRLAAFTKQLLTSALQLPEKSTTAMLGLTAQVVKTHKRRISALWNTEERRGDGMFDALQAQIEGSNPFATTIWEGELLRLHYAPGVREGVANVETMLRQA